MKWIQNTNVIIMVLRALHFIIWVFSERSIEVMRHSNPARPKSSHAYDTKCSVLDKLGRFGEALKCIEKSIELNPTKICNYCNRARAYQGLGKTELAAKEFKYATKLVEQGGFKDLSENNVKYVHEILDDFVRAEKLMQSASPM